MITAEKLKQGDKLLYTGKGFIGFSKNDRDMEFVKIYEGSLLDIWVKYQGYNLVVSRYDVELPKRIR